MLERHGRDLTGQEWRGVVLAILDRRATLLRSGIGGERYWSEARGWRADAFARGVRLGSQRQGAPT